MALFYYKEKKNKPSKNIDGAGTEKSERREDADV